MANEIWKNGPLPDWLPCTDLFRGVRYYHVPAFQRLEDNLTDMIPNDERFLWIHGVDGKPCEDPKLKSELQEEFSEIFFPSRMDHDKWYCKVGKKWGQRFVVDNYPEFSQSQFKKEFVTFRKYSHRHLGLLPMVGHDFKMIYDSRLQHPSTDWAFSAWREDMTRPMMHRKKHYCKWWAKRFPIMGRMVDFAMLKQHRLIIAEPTAIGGFVMKRILLGYFSHIACMVLSVVSIGLASYRLRWPSIFLFPSVFSVYCAYFCNWEYDKDPIHHYDYWTSWTNDPEEVVCFGHIDIHPNLVLEERVTFMLRDDLTYRKTLNTIFSSMAIYYSIKALFYRLKFKDVGADMAWEILKRNICEQTSHVIYLAGPTNHRCYYQPFTWWGDRMFHWICFALVHFYILAPSIKRIRNYVDYKTRVRLCINEVTFRAMLGQRRYMRLCEPMYWTFRSQYPRDLMGMRDRWYLSQRHRRTPGSHQFYF